MSAYFIECCKDHAESMKNREAALEKLVIKYTAKIEILQEERMDLEQGIKNWEEEEADQ